MRTDDEQIPLGIETVDVIQTADLDGPRRNAQKGCAARVE
jgi:hypothetical protein